MHSRVALIKFPRVECGVRLEKGKTLESSKPVGYIDLLRRNRNFRQLWLGQVVSQMGDWFDTIALYDHFESDWLRTRRWPDACRALHTEFSFGPLSGVVQIVLAAAQS